MDIFSTAVLNRVVENLRPPSSFLLDMFFGEVQTSNTDEIRFDVNNSRPRITPFVSPLSPGQVVAQPGYAAKSLKPAYAKDKRYFDPQAPLRRRVGERIGGDMTPMQRREAQVAWNLQDQLEMLTRREEVMAAEALQYGRVTIVGDRYPEAVVDFGRDAALQGTLGASVEWGDAGVDIEDSIDTWIGDAQTKSGHVVDTIVMDPLAWRLFRADEELREMLEMRRGAEAVNINLYPGVQEQGKARYVGSMGTVDYWVYQDVYLDVDPATGLLVEKKMLADYTVIGGSRSGLEGVRAYGRIQDEKANYEAMRYFSKSWLEEDPAVRWMLLQSAPLVFPYRPNASFRKIVKTA
jgi:hypothetical protein